MSIHYKCLDEERFVGGCGRKWRDVFVTTCSRLRLAPSKFAIRGCPFFGVLLRVDVVYGLSSVPPICESCAWNARERERGRISSSAARTLGIIQARFYELLPLLGFR